VIEATGGYEMLVVAALHAGGLPVVLANPRWVRAFAKGIG
jgi:transposase